MNRLDQYERVDVMTAGRTGIIAMLCDGVVRFNGMAREAIKAGDVERRNRYINRSIAIVSELSGSLDMDKGGEIAKNLARLYEYSIFQLGRANMKNSPEDLESVTRLFRELAKGWRHLAETQASKGASGGSGADRK